MEGPEGRGRGVGEDVGVSIPRGLDKPVPPGDLNHAEPRRRVEVPEERLDRHGEALAVDPPARAVELPRAEVGQPGGADPGQVELADGAGRVRALPAVDVNGLPRRARLRGHEQRGSPDDGRSAAGRRVGGHGRQLRPDHGAVFRAAPGRAELADGEPGDRRPQRGERERARLVQVVELHHGVADPHPVAVPVPFLALVGGRGLQHRRRGPEGRPAGSGVPEGCQPNASRMPDVIPNPTRMPQTTRAAFTRALESIWGELPCPPPCRRPRGMPSLGDGRYQSYPVCNASVNLISSTTFYWFSELTVVRAGSRRAANGSRPIAAAVVSGAGPRLLHAPARSVPGGEA